MSKHVTKTLCPRCSTTLIAHVHCANKACTFHIHVCDTCDPEQAVTAFMADHMKDCAAEPPAQLTLAA